MHQYSTDLRFARSQLSAHIYYVELQVRKVKQFQKLKYIKQSDTSVMLIDTSLSKCLTLFLLFNNELSVCKTNYILNVTIDIQRTT